ncbi:MAG TPA: hypothetical protein VJ907_06035 [Halanaerobiales bacterium]|nr:hypothetical protein [Halanaerobiales bacterium]
MGFLNLLYQKFKYDKHLNLSEEQIKQFQKEKLKKLVKYSFKNSEFYKDLFMQSEIRYEDLEHIDLKDLPTVNKSMLMNNFNKVVTKNSITKDKVINFVDHNPKPTALLDNKFHIIHSSGTSGEIGYYIYDNKNWELLKAVGASRLFKSFGLQRKKYAFIGASDGHYAGISFFLSPVNKFEQYFYQDFLVMDINYPLNTYIDKLNKLQPDIISGYPSAINMLLDYQKNNKLNIKPNHIICGGEPLTQEAYDKIKKYWHKEPVNYYGTSESIMMGAGFGKEGIYIFDDLIILEFAGNKTYLTNLYNYTEPLIRYEMDDLIVKGEKENKKWPFTYIKNISGREEDLLWLENENNNMDFIHPIVFVELHIKGLKKIQIFKVNDLNIIFKAVPKENVKKETIKNNIVIKMDEILKKKNMKNIKLDIELVDNIPNSPQTGKHELIKTKSNNK